MPTLADLRFSTTARIFKRLRDLETNGEGFLLLDKHMLYLNSQNSKAQLGCSSSIFWVMPSNSMQFILHCQEFCKSLGLAKKLPLQKPWKLLEEQRQKFFGKIHDSLARLYFIGLQGKEGEDIHKGACAVFHVLSLLFFYFRPLANPPEKPRVIDKD